MTIRYEPTHSMNQVSNGRYMTFAEHEELVRELIESVGEYFNQVESGGLSAADAINVVRLFIRMRM